MESGALSDEGFPEFAKSCVLFCHITTRIEGRKDDGLLTTVGGRGFPHLVAMDASGKVIANLEGDRTIEGFQGMMKSGQEYHDLKVKAEKGDPAAKIEYFIRALKLGEFKLDAARKYNESLKGVTPEQKARIDGEIVGLEVNDILEPLNTARDRAKAKELQIGGIL